MERKRRVAKREKRWENEEEMIWLAVRAKQAAFLTSFDIVCSEWSLYLQDCRGESNLHSYTTPTQSSLHVDTVVCVSVLVNNVLGIHHLH